MPLTKDQITNNDFYQNVEDADKQKLLAEMEKQYKRAAISGSVDSNNPLRDERGFLLSYEDPDNPGVSIDKPYMYVKLELKQKSATRQNVNRFFGSELDFTEIS
tara:strand:+ start:2041 stop:2352 length:312 start_codon:yes stop_codon:yes gene_type:complete